MADNVQTLSISQETDPPMWGIFPFDGFAFSDWLDDGQLGDSWARIIGLDYVSGGGSWIRRFGREGYYYRQSPGFELVSNLPSWASNINITNQFGGVPSNQILPLTPPHQPFLGETETEFTGAVWCDVDDEHLNGLQVQITSADSDVHLINLYSYDSSTDNSRWKYSVWNFDKSERLSDWMEVSTDVTTGVWARIVFKGDITIKMDLIEGTKTSLSAILFDKYLSDYSGVSVLTGDGIA